MCGWDKDGVRAHNKLVGFFSKMRQHDEVADLVSACDEWVTGNKPATMTMKRQRMLDSEKDEDESSFLEFT